MPKRKTSKASTRRTSKTSTRGTSKSSTRRTSKASTRRRTNLSNNKVVLAMKQMKENVNVLQTAVKNVTDKLEGLVDKSYDSLMKNAKKIWFEEFGTHLQDRDLHFLVFSFLKHKVQSDHMKQLKKLYKERIQTTQEGGSLLGSGLVTDNYFGGHTLQDNTDMAHYPGYINAINTHEYPVVSGGCQMGGSKCKGCKYCKKGKYRKQKRKTRKHRRNIQKGGSLFPINYMPPTILPESNIGSLSGPAAFGRDILDILNGSHVINNDPSTTGHLGLATNSILN